MTIQVSLKVPRLPTTMGTTAHPPPPSILDVGWSRSAANSTPGICQISDVPVMSPVAPMLLPPPGSCFFTLPLSAALCLVSYWVVACLSGWIVQPQSWPWQQIMLPHYASHQLH